MVIRGCKDVDCMTERASGRTDPPREELPSLPPPTEVKRKKMHDVGRLAGVATMLASCKKLIDQGRSRLQLPSYLFSVRGRSSPLIFHAASRVLQPETQARRRRSLCMPSFPFSFLRLMSLVQSLRKKGRFDSLIAT